MLTRRDLLVRSGIGAAATLLAGTSSWATATPPARQTGTLLVSSCVASRHFADAFTSASGHLLPVERPYQSGSAYLAELCTALAPSNGPSHQEEPHYLAGLVSRGDWEIVDILLPRRATLHESGLAHAADRQLVVTRAEALARQRFAPPASPDNKLQGRLAGTAAYVAFLYLI